MRRIFIVLIGVYTLFFTACKPEPEIPPWNPERIKVDGNRFVNESGETVIFRGYQIQEADLYVKVAFAVADGHSWWWDEDDNSHTLTSTTHFIDINKAIAETKKWGANVIRHNIYPINLTFFGVDKMLNEVEKWVRAAAENEIYSIICLHAIGYLPDYPNGSTNQTVGRSPWEIALVTNPAQYNEFWDKVSKRFRGNKAVAMYEIFNEPTKDENNPFNEIRYWNDWMTYATGTIDMIRNNDPDTVVLVGAPNWADSLYGTDISGSNGFIGRSNVAYAIHVYPHTAKYYAFPRDADDHNNWEKAWGRYANTVPIVISEVGYGSSALHPEDPGLSDYLESTYQGPGRYRNAIMDYIESKKVSWTAFGISDIPWHENGDYPHVNELSLTSDRNFTLSDWGEFVVPYTRGW